MEEGKLYIAVDHGRGDDWTGECLFEVLPDGKIMVHDIHQYRRTIELTAEFSEPPHTPPA